jgi:hypothetical protein
MITVSYRTGVIYYMHMLIDDRVAWINYIVIQEADFLSQNMR